MERKIAFVLASTGHGTMIVNRFDRCMVDKIRGYGVGHQILETGSHDPDEVELAIRLLDLRRKHYGDGVIAVDCGANIGTHTVEWATHMANWGSVLAIEAQERIYYALAGNIALNNCFNARAVHAAVSNQSGTMRVPQPNYLFPGSFGSLELRKRDDTEFIGQHVDYSESAMTIISTVTLDSFNFPRLDLIKMDIEGMEEEALAGAETCITLHQPILLVESIKSDERKLRAWFERFDYSWCKVGMNILALHKTDKCVPELEGQKAA